MSLDFILDRLAGQPVIPRRKKRLRPARFYVEALEGRVLLTTYTVTTTALYFTGDPSGVDQLGLATAIIDANNNVQNTSSGPAVIDFKIPGGGVQTIHVAPNPDDPAEQTLPTITRPVTIDGTTQFGYTAGHPMIEIDGTNARPNLDGLAFTVGGNTVKGLIINNFKQGYGIVLDGTNDTSHGKGPGLNNIIQGNFIGTDKTGTTAAPNGVGGIDVFNSSYNLIGGVNQTGSLVDGNLISGNGQSGIFLATQADTHNYIEGNYLGTDVTGLKAVPNKLEGVALVPPAGQEAIGFASDNFIGSFDPRSNQYEPFGINVIAGNTNSGVYIAGGSGNQVAGNYIGVGSDGQTVVSNGDDGIRMEDASSNIIGGTQVGARNVISGNLRSGIVILSVPTSQNGLAIPVKQESSQFNTIQGNYIGTDATGTRSIPNGDPSATGSELYGEGILLSNQVSDPSVSVSFNTIGGVNTNPGGVLAGSGNLISGNWDDGILVQGNNVSVNTVAGNYIGTDVTGQHPLINSYFGVELNAIKNQTGAPNANIIGSPETGGGNLISSNGTEAQGKTPAIGGGVGIENGASANLVQNNFIGTDASGLKFLPNSGNGVLIFTANGNTIGGETEDDANVISGNQGDGVAIVNATGNKLEKNEIGVGFDDATPLPNLQGVALSGATGNFIGGVQTVGNQQNSLGNVISGNDDAGILLLDQANSNQIVGNMIGTDLTGKANLGNGDAGIQINDSSSNTIGGIDPTTGQPTTAAHNLIVFNGSDGIDIESDVLAGQSAGNLIEGDYIGIGSDGVQPEGNKFNGVLINNSSSNVVGGGNIFHLLLDVPDDNVISDNGLNGVQIRGKQSQSNVVAGNYIGLTADGTTAAPNGASSTGTSAILFESGVLVTNGASSTTIGAAGSAGRNVVSGNTAVGIYLADAGSNSTVQDNYIGTNAVGSGPPTGSTTQSIGVVVDDTPGTTIGAASFDQGGNVISGNGLDGINLDGPKSTGTMITGNYIGTDKDAASPVGNGRDGVNFATDSAVGNGGPVGNPTVATTVDGNTIAGNLQGGIVLSDGTTNVHITNNDIGTNSALISLPNDGYGILVSDSPGNFIGAEDAGNQIDFTAVDKKNTDVNGFGVLITGEASTLEDVASNVVAYNATAGIQIDGGAFGNKIGNTQSNTIIGNLNGIVISDSRTQFNTVENNYVGIYPDDTAAKNTHDGILVTGGATYNFIGVVSDDGFSNIISANAFDGIEISGQETSNNTVVNNGIGTNAAGLNRIGFGNMSNGAGVGIEISAPDNQIGGDADFTRNLIVQGFQGIALDGASATGNNILGNEISNNGANGILITNGASGNNIGGPNKNDGNQIHDNASDGVHVISGTDDAIRNDTIFANGKLGIDLNLQANANNSLLPPQLSLGTPSRLTGWLQAAPNTTYFIEFFEGHSFQNADGSEDDDAKSIVVPVLPPSSPIITPVKFDRVSTDAAGVALFDLTFNESPAVGTVIRATVTDPNGDTSEFSDDVVVGTDSSGVGVPDDEQNGNAPSPFGVSFPDALDSSLFVHLQAEEGSFKNVWSVPDPDPNDPNGPPSNTQFGLGFISFSVTGFPAPTPDDPDGEVKVLITLPPTTTAPTSYWRYGPTKDDVVDVGGVPTNPDHWYQWMWSGEGTTGAQIIGNSIVLHLIDGALGDDDLTANGTIVDAGGPGFADPYTVTTTADSGPGSLRQAIENANANPRSTITFDLPGSGTQTIQLLSPLPAITADVTIDGSTEPGFAGAPLVVLDGSQAGAGADGLKVTSGFAKIQDLVIDHFSGDGIHVLSGGSAIIVGNYIGTDASGKVAQGNGLYGVEIDDDTPDPVDPDNDGDDDNALDNADDDDDAGQSQSITIDGGNVISANLAGGIFVHGAKAKDNQITNNFIGTQADGVSPLGNGGPGVVIDGGSNFNTIGFEPGTGNTIAYNAGPGVKIVNGINNLIESNSIFANQGLGIDLAGGQNANESQVAPVLAGATSYGGQTFISGTLTSTPNSSYTIDLYATDQGDESGGPQGQFLLGSVTVTTDKNGQASFDVDLATSATSGSFITATASLNDGETSPFSAPFALTTTNPLVLIVTTGYDVAGCMGFTLRQAILASNAHPGQNIIDFDLPNSDRVVQPQSALPTITNPVIIDGTSQPGYQGLPLVDLDGSQAGAGADGLDITCGGSIVRGLAIHSFSGNGIDLSGPGGNLIEGDFLGTDVTGTKAMPDQGLDLYLNGSPNNLIGGTTAAARNIILDVDLAGTGSTDNLVEGNYIGSDLTGTAVLENSFRHGIEIVGGSNTIGGLQAGAGNLIERGLAIDGNSNSNIVQGNLIGTDVTGAVFLSSGAGFSNLTDVEVFGSDNQIGGTTAAARNIIPGGVSLGGSTNLVQGNYIGTDITGTVALGGSLGAGFYVAGSSNTIGGTQPGAGNLISGMGNDGISVGSASNAVIQGNRIGTDVTGTKALGNYAQGIQDAGSDDTIGGNLISGNGYSGILLDGSGDVVEGNLIGTDYTGTKAIGNGRNWLSNLSNVTSNDFAAGIGLRESGAIIGGSQPGDGNVISGNVGSGIADTDGLSHLTGLVIQGNFIGTDATGMMPLGNGGDGVGIVNIASYATNSVIGGASPGAGNVIAANGGDGIRISDDPTFALAGDISSGTVIQGNKVGTDVTGTHNLGNAGDGVSIITSNLLPSDETIGGTSPGEGNTIAFNGGRGVDIPSGNGNTVRANNIFDNGGLGLITDINGAAATYAENRGIQLAQVPPVLTSAVFNAQGTVVTGSLSGTPFTSYEIDFFANSAVNPTGFGDGQAYLQSISVVVDDTGLVQFQIPLDEAVPVGQWITATATPDTTSGNTSMFSQPAPVVAAAGNTIQFSSPNYLVTETGGSAVIVVTRSGDTSGTATVDYATTGGTATAGVNYTAESGTLTFAVGVASQAITVPVKDDGLADGNKDFQIVLSNPGGSSLGAVSTADVAIADSDAADQIEFSSLTYSVDLALAREAVGTAAGVPPSVFTITRTGGSQAAMSVDYFVTGGTAVSAGYVVDSFGTVTFAPGQTTAQIQFGYGEPAYQGPQTLQVTIGNPTGGAVLGAITTSVLTIDDPEDQNGAFRIPSQLQVYESGDQITAPSAPQTFKLSSDAMFNVTVGATSTTVDLPASGTGANASVNDLVNELDTALKAAGLGGNPTVTTKLVYNVYANASSTGAIMLITNAPASLGPFSISDAGPGTSNDGYAELGFTNPQGAPGQAVIEVDRLGQSSTTEEVSFNTVDGTAKAGTNYVATSGTVTFQPGQTQADIDVPIIDDHLNDSPGTFQVVLSDPTGGAVVLDGLGQSTVTILDRDASAPFPPATLVVETVNNQGSFGGFPENSGTARIIVKRVDAITGVADGDGATGEVQVDYATSDGTAHAGSDYTAESGTLTFGPGQAFASFSVPLIPGQDVPDSRTFLVTLGNVVGNAVISADNPVTETIDGTPGQINFASPTYTVVENSAGLAVTVTNLPGANEVGANVTVDYATHDGTAIAGTEYTAVSGTLTFTPFTAGATSQTITIPILNDQLLENQPTTFSLTLSNPTGGPSLGDISTTAITILEDGDSQIPTVPSTTTVKSDKPNGSVYGQAVTFTATVSAATGTPSGAVDFVDTTTGQDLGTVPLVLVGCSGQASLIVSSLGVGSDAIVANYTGDTGTYMVSHGSLTQLVTPAKLKVTAPNEFMVFGATVPTLTDTITGFVNGDTASVVSGAASLSAAATPTSGVGNYPITVGQGTLSAANYTFTFVGGFLSVLPAKLTLTVTAANETMVYGATVPALTDTITGFVEGDTASVVTGAPSITTTATSASGVDTYPIDVSLGTLSATNYTFAFVPGTLTVTPATLTVTAGSTTMVYGATVPTVTDTISGFVNGDTSSVVTGTPSLGTIATSASAVGTYTYSVGLGTLSAANYTFAFVGGTLAVTPVMLTVTADNQTQLYGSADPPLTDTITGFVNGDASNVVSGAASLNTTATSASGVGNYAITAGLGTLSAANYTFAFAKGTLTVTPATLTITADAKTMVYGATVPTLANTISGFVNGDTSSVVNGTPSLSTAATTASGVGSYAITAGLGTLSAANYTFAFVNGTLSVTPVTLTVTADAKTMVYGATVPTLTNTITGFVNGDTSSVVSGAASLGTAAISASSVGSYTITAVPGTLSATNYTFEFADGTLTVTPARLTVTADNKTMVFGATAPTLTDTISGFVNGDTSSVVSGAASLTTTATSASSVGSYPITVGAGTLNTPNYTFTFVNGTLSVVPAELTLTVTADHQTMVYGATVPTLTATITGFVNGDTSSVVSGAASLSTTATSASSVGSYPIDVSLGTLSAANYTFAFVNGTLTVTPATLTVLAKDQTMVYGGTLPVLTDSIYGFVNGETSSVVSGAASLSTTATSASNVGGYTITAGAGTLSAANYTFVFVNGTLSVTPATLTVTADNKTMVFGATVPTLTDTITGFVNGDTSSVVSGTASLSTTATSASGVGNYTITVGAGTLSAPNYTFTFVNGTLSVTSATLTLTVTADDKTMVYGGTVPALTDSITGFVNGDTVSVVSGAASLSTTATSASSVGSYPIDVSLGTLSAANYAFAFVDGTLTVTPATLTVTADNKTMVVGATLPALTDTITGFVNSDTASVVSGTPALSTTATSASGVGSYTINAGLGTLSAANYTFALVNGTLAVKAANTPVLTLVHDTPASATEGSSGTLTSALLETSDSDSSVAASAIVYTITAAPTLGTLADKGTPLATGGNFSQQDIDDGSVTYRSTEEGADSFAFSVASGAALPITGTLAITASDPAVVATGGFTYSATAGALGAAETLATFTDPGGAESLADYAATIDWGDGTSATAGMLSVDPNTHLFTVAGQHKYAADGTFAIKVTLVHESAPTLTVTSTAGIASATGTGEGGIVATGLAVSGYEFGSLTGVRVATFTDTDVSLTAGDFSALIDWGDGATSAGTVTASSGNAGGTPAPQYAVTGSHEYLDESHYIIEVSIRQTAGPVTGGTSTTIDATATIHEQPLANGLVGTPDQNYIQEIYRDLFGRQADLHGLDYWVAELTQGLPRQQVAFQMVKIASFEEFQHDTVATLYEQYLGRTPDAGGLAYWSAYLYDGGTIEGMSQALVSSAEYWHSRGGGTATGFLNALFHDALGRQIEPAAVTYFEGLMSDGWSAGDVAAAVFNSDEYHRMRVDALFEQFMNREADQGALAYFAGELDKGGTDELVISQLVGSDEYFAKVQV